LFFINNSLNDPINTTSNIFFLEETSGDTIVDEVREKLLQRSKVGQNKYNNNLDRSDLSLKEWANTNKIKEELEIVKQLRNIYMCCNNKRNKAYGFKWKYKEN